MRFINPLKLINLALSSSTKAFYLIDHTGAESQGCESKTNKGFKQNKRKDARK